MTFLDKILLAIETKPPQRSVESYGGEGVQEGFTNLFGFFDSFWCVLAGLFTGVWGSAC